MKSVTVERVIHKGESRIALRFSYDRELVAIVKGITDSRWSQSMNCWHVPDNAEALTNLGMDIGEKAMINWSGITLPSNEAGQRQRVDKSRDISKASTDFDRPSAMPARSDAKVMDERFKQSYGSQAAGNKLIEPGMVYDPVAFTINETEGKLIIKFTGRYDREWIKELKSYGRIWFDADSKEWLLGWSRMKVDSLSDYFASKGIEVIVKKPVLPLSVREQRLQKGIQIREKEISLVTMNGIEVVRRFLNEKRYSKNTVENYISLLELFFKYFSDKASGEINEDDISDFFHDFIVYNNYSGSYHNQLISAIKMYYRLNGSIYIDTSALGRPRRGRALPKVFSKEEVKLILNGSRNLKHRLILWMIYSCGLRRSEVINIRITDLDRTRGILNIKEAKGMNDRIVPVSEKVWEKVDEYFNSYHPVFWLFEGQTGGQYSSESVYRVFKQALKNAGIRKDVGVHSLRHSYATHLHENGVDIRYIQELLGHRSSRTTEIYTHVSRRNLVAVRSPIDDLDLK
jgi:integrase/recombinase XerD